MTQPESKLSLKIKTALMDRGAYMWKVHGNEFTPTGLPDLVGVYRGLFIGVETKEPGKTCSPIQEYRIKKLQEAGALIMAPCYTVARAVEFITDVECMLREIATPGGSTGRYWRDYCDRQYGRGWSVC